MHARIGRGGRLPAAVGAGERAEVPLHGVPHARHRLQVFLRAAVLRGGAAAARGHGGPRGRAGQPPVRIRRLLHSARGGLSSMYSRWFWVGFWFRSTWLRSVLSTGKLRFCTRGGPPISKQRGAGGGKDSQTRSRPVWLFQ